MNRIIKTAAIAAMAAIGVIGAAGAAHADTREGVKIEVTTTVHQDGLAFSHDFTGTITDQATGAFTATGTNVDIATDGGSYIYSMSGNEHIVGTYKGGKLTITSGSRDMDAYTWVGSAKTPNSQGGAFTKAGSWSTVNDLGYGTHTNDTLTGSVTLG